jgi:riboflavin kinase/FMN adenylyltransferase
VGESFRFGRAREGDVARLRRIGAAQGFEVHVVRPVLRDGETASSSIIRAAVSAGQVERARRLLGRPFELQGRVVRGDGRGRRLRYPTANVEVENELYPSNGVYITETVVLATRFASLANVGTRPTFLGRTRTVESHLLDYEGDLYDEPLSLRFLARIRDEMRFANASELADQIARDRAAAESYFQQAPLSTS